MANNDTHARDLAEIAAALLLGLAAIAIAWSTYQSALWGGQQDEAYTESTREASNAVDLLQAADTTRTLDQILFAQILTSGVCDDGGDDCERVLSGMSEEGAVAVEEWLAGSRESNPFDSEPYLEALYRPGNGARLASDEFFTAAGEANRNGDDFELASTVLTAVLFFAGISVVIHGARLRVALLALAGVLLVGGSAYLVSLPPA